MAGTPVAADEEQPLLSGSTAEEQIPTGSGLGEAASLLAHAIFSAISEVAQAVTRASYHSAVSTVRWGRKRAASSDGGCLTKVQAI